MVLSRRRVTQSLFEIIQENWAELGIEVKPKPVGYDELVESYLEPRSYQAALVDLNLYRSPDPTRIHSGTSAGNWWAELQQVERPPRQRVP